jgi:hypothetical protein
LRRPAFPVPGFVRSLIRRDIAWPCGNIASLRFDGALWSRKITLQSLNLCLNCRNIEAFCRIMPTKQRNVPLRRAYAR